jgi:hypothetical protein
MNDGEAIVNGIRSITPDVRLCGGLAGDDFLMKETFVYSNGKYIKSGISLLAFDLAHISFGSLATSGWKTVGIEKVITKAEGNIVYEIDNEPAIDVIIKNFKLPANMTPTEIVTLVGAQYPFHVYRPDGTSVIRACLMITPDNKGLVFAGTVPQGAKVKFSVAPDLDIIEASVAEIQSLQADFTNPSCVLAYSCKARHLSLGPMIEQETSGVRNIWEIPLAGVFTYGEIGEKLNSSCDFHNETLSIVVIGEK